MLAYELYLKNKESNANNPRSGLKPLKKIFYQNKTVNIDKKNLEEYDANYSDKHKVLQDWLQMPLNTLDSQRLNLPDFRTGSAGRNPYIEIYGYLKTNKKLETTLTISIGKKPNFIEYSLDMKNGKIKKTNSSRVNLKLDQKNYLIGSDELFSEYVKSGLINKDGMLDLEAFDQIARKFLDYTKRQTPNITKPGAASFGLFILPNNSKISFKQNKQSQPNSESFTDYFGNSVSDYATDRTSTAKWLSYDDSAFTINCKQGKEFYQNIGIGNSSLKKIYVDKEQTFNISGLTWTFVDISPKSHYKFIDTRKGIFSQLFENYQNLANNAPLRQKIHLKIVCNRINQAKQEILIDENLTMEKMKNLFEGTSANTPPLAFEVLIDNSGRNTIWSAYLLAVKNFLSGNITSRDYLLSFFQRRVAQQRYDWIKSKNDKDQKEFFTRAEFCLKTLCNPNRSLELITPSENFAVNVGLIARAYLEFKQKNKDTDNSTSDILTYSKYDREKLRFVISRIGIGIQLSKVSEGLKKEITDKISSLNPKEEISDSEASKDFSYFFFKGYYTNPEVMA